MEYVKLYNGLTMPIFGIGTYLLTPDEAENSVTAALECGYRLIDTANMYANEKAVGRAMRSSGVPRGEIFLETKIGRRITLPRMRLTELLNDWVRIILISC